VVVDRRDQPDRPVPQNFYLLYCASQAITAFNSIGTSLSKLRLAP
jgi:hypothetical protein